MSGPMMFNDPPVRTEAMLALFRTIQRRLLLLTAGAAVLGVLVGLLVAQTPGVWGALLAAGLGLVFTFTTVATLRFLVGRGPELLQIVLIGSWLIKMALVVVLMLWLRSQDFYDRGVFFVTLAVVVIGAVAVEIGTIANARIPTVEPGRPLAADVSRVTPERDPGAPQPPADEERRNRADGETIARSGDRADQPDERA
ncbi:hypothetical protein [Pseudactinotalea suaedae]|uniref:hypothetical protein n=1 Tax=Pseudactinotalea suaedae TaxID=1524924 RepID=UPI0012E20E53|nr:hypothetical protein [Pseudactinotalea suaedae]